MSVHEPGPMSPFERDMSRTVRVFRVGLVVVGVVFALAGLTLLLIRSVPAFSGWSLLVLGLLCALLRVVLDLRDTRNQVRRDGIMRKRTLRERLFVGGAIALVFAAFGSASYGRSAGAEAGWYIFAASAIGPLCFLIAAFFVKKR